MKKLLLIAILSIFTAFSLTACSRQDVDKAVQKVSDVIEDNKISQEQLDSAEDAFNNVKDKAVEIIDEAKDAVSDEVEKSTDEETTVEEETTQDGKDSAFNNKGVKFNIEKANGANDHNLTIAAGNEVTVSSDDVSIDTTNILNHYNSVFDTKNLFYRTNCIEDVASYVNIVEESRSGEHSGNVGLDIRKMVANDAYLKALSVLSKIDFEDINVSSKLVNKYNVSEEEFTKALIEMLSNM